MNIQNKLQEFISYQNQETIFLFLIFFLMFAMINIILNKIDLFSKNKGATGIIAIVISMLGTFYLTKTQIYTILLSYNTFGLIFLFLIPFFIIAIFLYKSNLPSAIRRIIWVIFGIITIYFQNKNNLNISEDFILGFVIFIILIIILDNQIYKNLFNKNKKNDNNK